ncbi:MAG: carbamoyltransferase HypF [Desulfovibrionaceae bacterium]|nr:carbamoyltransferase HypF [Desulfovibrionaceae bacterium]
MTRKKTARPMLRRCLTATGQVQGVGFRPFVYRLAVGLNLAGSVLNSPEGVVIEVQGTEDGVEAFENRLRTELPPLAKIVGLTVRDLEPTPGQTGFSIKHSARGAGHNVLISPDTATCAECLAEVFDPQDRRHLYPFTNCTNCGPRYTITRSIPYDRPQTSMACFKLCPRCLAEYQDPLDRRFHAQPTACPECGPRVWLTDKSGRNLAGPDQALEVLARRLAGGEIAAIKGLGGFHLACDAGNQAAVTELRRRKDRPAKPLGIMVPDLDAARSLALVSEAEAEWLSGTTRPIVLLRKGHGPGPAPAVAPDTDFLGIMLPYTPLHHILLDHYRRIIGPQRVPALVMTSGNARSEPICLGNREALSRLAAIADFFLLHDRDILIRTDDSVMRVNPAGGAPLVMRRARGFTPRPVFLAQDGPCVLGVGPELKCALCLTKSDQAFSSQHIGDLENLETLGFYKEILKHLEAVLEVEPRAVVHDLHPNYMTTGLARELAAKRGIPALALQHHFAHIHAVLAENRHQGPALGLALDGTGYGEDKTIWGGECLLVDASSLRQERLGHLRPFVLPGGEAAVRQPWRLAQALLWELGLSEPGRRPWPWLKDYGQASRFLPQMLAAKVNCPTTTSCGRLFDAVSALLGLVLEISYEGQAAIVLEKVQERSEDRAYPCPVLDGSPAVLDSFELFRACVEDAEAGVPAPIVSRRFHLGLINGLANLAERMGHETGIRTCGLSGGVMQNLTMAVELPGALRQRGLEVLVHTELPPNDACVSLGQAAWGRRVLALKGL